jgi:hypothetical protein
MDAKKNPGNDFYCCPDLSFTDRNEKHAAAAG